MYWLASPFQEKRHKPCVAVSPSSHIHRMVSVGTTAPNWNAYAAGDAEVPGYRVLVVVSADILTAVWPPVVGGGPAEGRSRDQSWRDTAQAATSTRSPTWRTDDVHTDAQQGAPIVGGSSAVEGAGHNCDLSRVLHCQRDRRHA